MACLHFCFFLLCVSIFFAVRSGGFRRVAIDCLETSLNGSRAVSAPMLPCVEVFPCTSAPISRYLSAHSQHLVCPLYSRLYNGCITLNNLCHIKLYTTVLSVAYLQTTVFAKCTTVYSHMTKIVLFLIQPSFIYYLHLVV